MTALQRLAADPSRHVWVAASAGSGKTKVLTDRVLRLLLSGTAPHRILCLTYTNAAAAEMRTRLGRELAQWAVLPDERCRQALESLTGEAVDARQLARARRLFAQVLDAPEGVRIQTIHAFCQSLLRRFPVEAGVAPNLELLDDRGQGALLAEARRRLLLGNHPQAQDIAQAFAQLADEAELITLENLLTDMARQRRRFGLEIDLVTLDTFRQALWRHLGTRAEEDEPQRFAAHFTYDETTLAQLRAVARAGTESPKKTSQETAARLAAWLTQPERGPRQLGEYLPALLTKELEPRKSLMTVDVHAALPSAEEILRAEQARLTGYLAASETWRTARHAESLLTLFFGMMALYATLKRRRGVMDYDDLLLHAIALLKRPGISAWILYKLDGGIDHVLIDEAQDTSPEQWTIVELLTQEFFAGEGAHRRPRSLFVVGDEKQSIYSFQGARPEAFDRMRAFFAAASARVEAPFERVRLATSFRSAPAVLAAVDATFADPATKAGLDLSESTIAHEAHRAGAGGVVELWPKTMPPEAEEGARQPRIETLHARTLAKVIAHWLAERRPLASQNRPLRPGDIMILVRTRGRVQDALVAQLKRLGVPVAGADRLELTEQLAVKDVLALCDFLLLPEDDLTLATILRSPFFNASEEALFALAHKREGSLVASLRAAAQNPDHPHHAFAHAAWEELAEWLNRVDYATPYALLSHILHTSGGLLRLERRLGTEVLDPLEELLEQALSYQHEECASLQGFVAWLRDGSTQIKRDMEQGRDEVRILTVHGAKGLQAPVVILADALAMQAPHESMLWGEAEGLPVGLWSRSTSKLVPQVMALREAQAQALAEERNRQLYVAMTRAEDELYITGWQGKAAREEESWYGQVARGLTRLEAEEYDFAARYDLATLQPAKRHATPQRDEPRPRAAHATAIPRLELPAFLTRPAPALPALPRPLAPSHQAEAQRAESAGTLSPIRDAAALRRGQCIHALLQWLPDVPPAQRTERARSWLRLRAGDLAEAENLLTAILTLLDDPRFAPLFAPGSLAEVPVSGLLTGADGLPRIVNAQIDRLRITEREIFILDYKTGQRLPRTPQAVPTGYLRQLAAYRALLARIYPAHTIRCALLFTEGPLLMELPDEVLNAAWVAG